VYPCFFIFQPGPSSAFNRKGVNVKLKAHFVKIAAVICFCLTITIASAKAVCAHCDTLDGPVVMSAREALDKSDIRPVLKWVKKEHESEIRDAFSRTVLVRAKGPEAKDLADMYFFETLVRIHRAGEGASYDGLKPAGLDLGPAIPAADKAIAEGNSEAVSNLLTGTIREGIREKFKSVMAKKNFNGYDVEAGREYVEAYVTFMHYIEEIYQAAYTGVHDRHGESGHLTIHEK